MEVDQWLERFASAVGTEPPEARQVEEILRLAAVAAHSSERRAAPVACWIAARSGRPLAEALELAEGIGD